VHRRLDRTFPQACIVASVHRMGLLSYFDRVVLMDAGRLVDSGTLEQLRDRQPAFARMLEGSGHAADLDALQLAQALGVETDAEIDH